MPRENSFRIASTGIQRGEHLTLTIDQHEVRAYAGETLATVLLAQGITIFNRTPKGQPRGPYCNMGTCFECQIQMAPQGSNTFSWIRACMVTVKPGMTIITGATLTAQTGETVAAKNVAPGDSADLPQKDDRNHEN
jgi:sarcosine oxidase subunit alpha